MNQTLDTISNDFIFLRVTKNNVQSGGVVEKKDGWKRVYIRNILTINAYGNYLKVLINEGGSEGEAIGQINLVIAGSLKEMQNKLEHKGWLLRCNRFQLVNTLHINFIDKEGKWLYMDGAKEPIQIGAGYKKDFLDKLELLKLRN